MKKVCVLFIAALCVFCSGCDKKPSSTPEPMLFEPSRGNVIFVELASHPGEYYAFTDRIRYGGEGAAFEYFLYACAIETFAYVPGEDATKNSFESFEHWKADSTDSWKAKVTFTSSYFTYTYPQGFSAHAVHRQRGLVS